MLLAVGRVGPWLLGLTTAVALCRLRGCSSWQGLWGRLSGIWVFGLTWREAARGKVKRMTVKSAQKKKLLLKKVYIPEVKEEVTEEEFNILLQ